jgi:signal transduction histidine kinase
LVCGQLFSSQFFFDFHRTNFSGFRRTFHQFRSGWLCYFCYSRGHSPTFRLCEREFIGSLFSSVAGAPLGARTEQPDLMTRDREQDELRELRVALRALLDENQQLFGELAEKNRDIADANGHELQVNSLVHEINNRVACIMIATDLMLCNAYSEISNDVRSDLELIARNCEKTGELIREVLESTRSRRSSSATDPSARA